MPRTATLLVLFTAFALCACPARAEDAGERRVEALVTIRFDPDSQAVLWPEVDALLRGSPRATWDGKAPAALAKLPDLYRVIDVGRADVDEVGALCVRVGLEVVGPHAGELRADRILDALVARVEMHIQERSAQERRQLRGTAAELESSIDQRTQLVASKREEGALPWPLSAAVFYENKLQRRADLHRELADLALDAATLKARQRAVDEQYSRLLEREQLAAAKTGSLEREWAKLLASRQSVLEDVKQRFQQGAAGRMDVVLAEDELAQARLQAAAALKADAAPSAARQELEAARMGLQVDAAALAATQKHLAKLHAELSKEVEEGKVDVLRIARVEDETQILRERLLGIQERMAAWRDPDVSVIRLD